MRSLFASLHAAEPVEMIVHAGRETTELRPIWNYFGYDEALTTLTSEGKHLLAELNKLSDEPVRIRVHHLHTSGDKTLALKWSSTNVYTEDAAGNPVYDWTTLDEIFDEFTRPGIEPFVQASFMPQALSAQPEPYAPPGLVTRGMPPSNILSGGAYHPPADYGKWQKFIETWVHHCVERHGRESVASWLWELWNEPESPYFAGTVEEYCKLYDHFTAAVKSVVPEARVGGPHTTDPKWRKGDEFMMQFLEHCRSGTNAVTGQKGAPLDFIAYHAKGLTKLDDQGRVEMEMRNQLWMIDLYSGIIALFPEFAKLPVYIGESDPEGCAGCPSTLDPQRDYRRTSQFASYSAASFMRKQDLVTEHGGSLQGAVSWAFTFHDQPWFNGLRALTTNEVALPVLNGFRLFSRLGSVRVESTSSGMLSTAEIIKDSVRDKADVGVVATRSDDGSLRVLVWNYHDVADKFDEATPVTLRIDGLTDEHDLAAATITRVDEYNANAFTAWRHLGEPQDPTAHQIAILKDAATLKAASLAPVTSAGATASFAFDLFGQSVALVEIPRK